MPNTDPSKQPRINVSCDNDIPKGFNASVELTKELTKWSINEYQFALDNLLSVLKHHETYLLSEEYEELNKFNQFKGKGEYVVEASRELAVINALMKNCKGKSELKTFVADKQEQILTLERKAERMFHHLREFVKSNADLQYKITHFIIPRDIAIGYKGNCYCPCCKKKLEVKINYCDNCGQILKYADDCNLPDELKENEILTNYEKLTILYENLKKQVEKGKVEENANVNLRSTSMSYKVNGKTKWKKLE